MQTHSQRAALLHHLFHKLTTTPKSFRSSPILKFPPWLEISQQIKYKNLICQLQRFSASTYKPQTSNLSLSTSSTALDVHLLSHFLTQRLVCYTQLQTTSLSSIASTRDQPPY